MRDITERQYAAGRDNQHDVIRAQLELSLVDERILTTEQNRESAIAALSRYIGIDEAIRPISEKFPVLKELPNRNDLIADLETHPLIRIENMLIKANKKRIAEIEETYKPSYTLDISYGKRSGNNQDSGSRPDFLSAMILMDLPIFTDKRQDQRLAEASKNHISTIYSRTDRLYEIRSMALKQMSDWENIGDRVGLYEQRAIVEAQTNTEATLQAYQNDLTDFTALMRAQLTELNTSIDELNVRIDRARAHINLLYFGGVE